ncbi:PAS domain S-box-containing protein [Haladaptatus litoreus]|uniref:histidine kinase n=1 Tax=Haladaptatus litoreus TaxID=553468 RepID=A0A1N7E8W3_9EURY|nr:PAS domain S-box protein [Haladaptatus litoreus]SIR84592.1 PAS domain S-box-containing protein [Haladaptatus litoreus]
MTTNFRVLYIDPLADTGVIPSDLERDAPELVVRTADDERAVLDAISDENVDCVVSGYTLPEGDGISLSKRVRDQFPDVPFVLCTTSGSERIASDAFETGIDGYVPTETDESRVTTLSKTITRVTTDARRPPERFDRYQSIVQAMGDGVYTLDTEGYVTAVNDTLLEMSLYDRDELVGEHISLLLDGVDVSRGDRLIKSLLQGDADVGELRAELKTADGGGIPCEARIGLLTHRDEFRGTVGVLRSIADHERIKAALREQKEKIEDLHEIASEMEACQTADEICELTVDAAESILEFDICGVDLAEDGYFIPKAISTGMTDDGYTKLRTDQGVAGRSYQNHETCVLDDVREEADAAPAQAEYRSLLSAPIGEEGIFQAGSREVGAFDHDDAELAELLLSHTTEALRRIHSQTALRESEEKYRTLVEQSHDAIYIYRDDSFVFVNRRVCELTGYDRDELAEMNLWELIHPDERERVKHIARERSRGNHPPHYDARVVTKDGDLRYAEFNVREITYEGEAAQLGSARDVTERKQELKRQNERLEEFASVVSHDLRNPLNVAQGHLELARERGDEIHFEKAGGALDRMGTLIADLLTLARQGLVVSDTEPVKLETIVRQAWANVETEESTLVVETQTEIDADRGRLQELFENLFRNAVEHAGSETTVRVGEIADESVDAETDDFTGFYVEDDGDGIPPAEREAVFDHGHTTADGGSGLGLSIVKGISEAHDWTISADEGSDGGARFRIQLD